MKKLSPSKRPTLRRDVHRTIKARDLLLTEESVEPIGKEDPTVFGTGCGDIHITCNNVENLRCAAAVSLGVVW
jgi:hypothetical protein